MMAVIGGVFSVTTGLLFVVGTLALWIVKRESRWSRRPPGPLAWPIIGNLFSFRRGAMHETLNAWRTKYGDVFRFYLGSEPVTVVCGYDNIREMLTKTGDDLLHRPIFPLALEFSKGMRGIIFSSGHRWKQTRSFSLMALRELGLGGQSLEQQVTKEAHAFCTLLESHCGQPMNIAPFFTCCVSNVICSIVFGRRFELGDPAFAKPAAAIKRMATKGGGNSIVTFLPWLRHLPCFNGYTVDMNTMEEFIRHQIDVHRVSFDPQQTRDFIDLYLQVESGEPGFDPTVFDEQHMYCIIRDLFIAGTETTATSLLWAVLFLVLHQDVQDRCREEVLRVFGKDGPPSMSLRTQMPYLEATMLETQRLGDITPLGVLRAPSRDLDWRDVMIPTNTRVMLYLSSVHQDPVAWPEPARFLPARWLDHEGRILRHEHFLPFSLGRRACPGEYVAKAELFLFTTTLLQQFHISLPPGAETPTMKGFVGGTRVPLPFQVVLTRL